MGDIVPLLVLLAASIVSAQNAIGSRGHGRLFWSLMTAGMAMWCCNQSFWVWFEVMLRRTLPNPFLGIWCCSCTLSHHGRRRHPPPSRRGA